ncbi:MAG TPA: ABC transporter ATP-binding protein [Burkholderiales bacterium]|nr:ABC transporter ATP-binding protein [Burkholderiales bacterium]
MTTQSRARDVQILELSKTFETKSGEQIHALKDVDLHIRPGEFVSVVGTSGCGKSTLMRIVCGLISATRGSVLVSGQAVDRPRDDVGVVFQNAVLLPWKTVKDNVLVPMDLRDRRRPEHEQRAEALLAMTGLTGFESKYPFELSGGMRQRVSICRALMCQPSFLALDEPFGALDAMTREAMNLELMRICGETRATVLFITHSVPEAVLLSDRVVVMTPRPGRIADVIDVRLPRPRTLKDYASDLFNDYTGRIRELLGAETLA